MWLQVAPHTASSGFAGVRSSSCPESRIHSALPAVFKFRVPPQLYFARRASRCITGFPGLCIFRPCRRSIVELAPTLVSFSASVASAASFPTASLFQLRLPIQVPSCPGSCIFRLYRQRTFELPRISRSSAPPVLELSVSLELRSSRLRLPMSLQVSLQTSSSGLALGLSLRVSPASLPLGVG